MQFCTYYISQTPHGGELSQATSILFRCSPAWCPETAPGSFEEDKLDAAELGKHQVEAIKVVDRAGWN